jgi:hypothetical protein
MIRRPFVKVLGVLVVLVALPACSSSPTSPTTTTTTTTTTASTTTTTSTTSVTETFEDSLTQGTANTHVFHTLLGTVTSTLSAIEPTEFYSGAIGFGVGTWDGNSCSLVIGSENAAPGTVLTGTATTELDLCVLVYDAGSLAPGFTLYYQVTVVHQALSGS